MTAIDVSAPIRSDRQRATTLIEGDARTVLGDEVGLDVRAGPAIRQPVAIALGARSRTGPAARWPLSWEPVGHDAALPAFVGTLEVCDLDDGTTRLRVCGEYRPPLGVLGLVVDKVIGHRLAEASIEQFAMGVARRVDRAASRAASPWRGPEAAPDLRPT
jgi:hypothetical protein